MKLQTLCIITFLSLLTVIKSDQLNPSTTPSFLRFVGSYKYNITDNGKVTLKRYYLSHRITYKWIDAFMSCKSVGMRLAFIESDNERGNLASIARQNSNLFQQRVFIDGYNLTVTGNDYEDERSEPEPCYSMQKESKSKLEVYSERCNDKSLKFLCEHFEVVDSYDDDPSRSAHLVDVKDTFFTYMGDFEKKKYYASFKLEAHTNDVPKICQSFGMGMLWPKNQAEYDNFAKLLQKFSDPWDSVSIAGYRSEENEDDWLVSNNKLNFTLDWNKGEPNNHYQNEHCIALKNVGIPKLNDVPCEAKDQFVCEFDESVNHAVEIIDQIEQGKFLRPLTQYEIGSLEKKLFVSLYEMDWLMAVLTCKNFGMQLLTASSETEDKILRETLEKSSDTPSTIHVGVTSMGTKDMWYSIANGQVFDFDFEWSPIDSNYYPEHSNCLRLVKRYVRFTYIVGTCINQVSRFICEKVIDRAEDITSTSPASWILSSTTKPVENITTATES